MGVPDNVFASDAHPAVSGDSLTKPLIIALLALLASRHLGGGQKEGSDSAQSPTDTSPSSPGILEGLGSLIDQFRQKGLGETVDTWVNPGANRGVAPYDISVVLGGNVVNELSWRTGLSRDRILVELSKLLPDWADQLTPNGQLPTPKDIARFMAGG